MTIQDLGSLGELIAAVATIATLVYLAMQIRQNTKQVRASTFQGVSRGWQEFLYALSSDDRGLIWSKGSVDPNALNEEEAIKYHLIVRAYLRGFENDYYQYGHGTFDAESWEGYRNSFRKDGLVHPGFRAMWELQREHFSSEFGAFVDRELESTTVNESTSILEEVGRSDPVSS